MGNEGQLGVSASRDGSIGLRSSLRELAATFTTFPCALKVRVADVICIAIINVKKGNNNFFSDCAKERKKFEQSQMRLKAKIE